MDNEIKLDSSYENNKIDFSDFDSENNNNQNLKLASNEEKHVKISSQININLDKKTQISSVDSNKIENQSKINYEISTKYGATLKENICTSIWRDLHLIIIKIFFVLNPFNTSSILIKQINQWDLWGPLIFTSILSLTNSIEKNSNNFVLIFIFFWVGSFIIFLNSYFLNNKISVFHFMCLLGYSLVPFVLMSLLFMLKINIILKILFGILALIWSLYVSFKFIKNKIDEKKMFLNMYPISLFFIFFFYLLVLK
jgi:hypothetical protein